jgi:hypothetical protein
MCNAFAKVARRTPGLSGITIWMDLDAHLALELTEQSAQHSHPVRAVRRGADEVDKERSIPVLLAPCAAPVGQERRFSTARLA